MCECLPIGCHVTQLDPFPLAREQHGVVADPGPTPDCMQPDLGGRTGTDTALAPGTQPGP